MAKTKVTRCAVYTRKSSEEGLDQSFNSLHAQREACEAYILSQRHEGWSVIPTPYDDGGFSGGSMERPALKALLADIDAGQVDVVVVYKIDRLTRSLFDFAKIVETLDAHNRMTPSHAIKNGKRYRYYISNHLIAGTTKSRETKSGEGLRIAAQEIEGHVIAAIAMFLANPQKIVAELCPDDVAPAVATAALRQARMLGNALTAEGTPDRYELIRSLTARVRIDDESICVELHRLALSRKLGLSIDAISRGSDDPLLLMMPAELRRLGKEKRLIVAAHAPKTNPDAVLIKAIVRGHQWFEMLKSRKVLSISDIANAEKLPRTYVGSVIPFAPLAPDITEAILEGTQPIDLNLDRLINLSLPIDWAEQRSVLGFK